MSPRAFIEPHAQLYYCPRCAAWQWTDLHHACDTRSEWATDREIAIATALSLLVWVAIALGVWRVMR